MAAVLPKDWKEFLQCLNAHGVEYMIVGGFAFAYHALPRFTGDIDILYRLTAENTDRLVAALHAFGFASLSIKQADLMVQGQFFQLGVFPNRIDLMNGITGLALEEPWHKKIPGMLDGVPVFYIDKDALIKNKRATGRHKDLEDLSCLED